MRKPLTRQNSTRDKRRYSAYQNRIFFYLVTLVTAPLLLLGVLSSVVYYRQTVTRSDALLASARENVETQMEIALSNLRAYYSAVVSADNYQTLCQKTVPPYSEYTLVRDMQTAMRGGNLVDKYVEGYTYINLRSGWILSNNGMYRLADAANRDEVAHLLGEWAEQHAAMMWVNRTDQPTPALADTPLNTVDLTGELLVLRSSSYRTGSYAVLIVKLDLSPLYEMTESWQTGGYSIAAGFHRQDRAEHLCCADRPAGRRHPRRGQLRAGWLAAEQRQDGRERADLLCGAAAAHAGGYRRHGDSDRFCAGRGTGGGAADLPPLDQCAVRPCG